MWERIATFWSRVNVSGADDCWEWKASVDKDTGYGNFCWNTKRGWAHRFAWFATHGEIPAKMCVCHHCDNRICVNPKHLFLGTIADNNRDMFKKGRGKNNPRPNITPEQVVLIRKLYIPNRIHGAHKISKELNLPLKSVECAIDKNKWKGIPWHELN
jgi:hypothetical protein